MIPESILLAAGGIGLFILGLILGMALERSAWKNSRRGDLTEWEGDQ